MASSWTEKVQPNGPRLQTKKGLSLSLLLNNRENQSLEHTSDFCRRDAETLIFSNWDDGSLLEP